SRKTTISTSCGRFTGDGTPSYHFVGRRHTYKSNSLRKATFSERIPPPIGVVKGPLMPTRYSLNVFNVSSGNQLPVSLKAFSPAKTSFQIIERLPAYALLTAASNTRTEAFQISGPIPSPIMNGIIVLLGTFNFPFAPIVIFSPMINSFSWSYPY